MNQIRLFVDHPLPVYLATLEVRGVASHRHTPVKEICSEGVIPLDDLHDFWWVSCRMARLQLVQKYPRKVKAPEYVTDDRQTDLPRH